jgi:hypothetical protein
VKLGTLALGFNRPGSALVKLLRAYQEARSQGLDAAAAMSSILQLTEDYRSACLAFIVERSVEELLVMHAGRGLGESASQTVARVVRSLIGQRSVDPFFELGWLSAERVSVEAFSVLLRDLVPCDVLQQRQYSEEALQRLEPDIDFMRDALYTFGAGEVDEDDSSGTMSLGAHHAQLHMLFAHLPNTEFVTSNTARAKCPFFTSCPHERRKIRPDVCRSQPWSAFSIGEESCWYGAAVAATLGTVVLRKRQT